MIKSFNPVYSSYKDALVPKMCKHCHQLMEIKQINLTEAVRQCYNCSTHLQHIEISDIEFFHRSYRDVSKEPQDWNQNVASEENELNLLQSWIGTLELTVNKYEDNSDDDDLTHHEKAVVNYDKIKSDGANYSHQESNNLWNNSSIDDELDAALEKISKEPRSLEELPFCLEDLFSSQPEQKTQKSESILEIPPNSIAEMEQATAAVDLLNNWLAEETASDAFGKKEVVPSSGQHFEIKTLETKGDSNEEIIEDHSCKDESLLAEFLTKSAAKINDSYGECLHLSSDAIGNGTMEGLHDVAGSDFGRTMLTYSRSATLKEKGGNSSRSSNCIRFCNQQDNVCQDELYQLPSSCDGENDNHCLELNLPKFLLTSLRETDVEEVQNCQKILFPTIIDKVILSPMPKSLKNNAATPSEKSFEVEPFGMSATSTENVGLNISDVNPSSTMPQDSSSTILISIPATEDSIMDKVILSPMLKSQEKNAATPSEELLDVEPFGKSDTSTDNVGLNFSDVVPLSTMPQDSANTILISIPATEDITAEMLQSISLDDMSIVFESVRDSQELEFSNQSQSTSISNVVNVDNFAAPNQLQTPVAKWVPNCGGLPMLVVEMGSSADMNPPQDAFDAPLMSTQSVSDSSPVPNIFVGSEDFNMQLPLNSKCIDGINSNVFQPSSILKSLDGFCQNKARVSSLESKQPSYVDLRHTNYDDHVDVDLSHTNYDDHVDVNRSSIENAWESFLSGGTPNKFSDSDLKNEIKRETCFNQLETIDDNESDALDELKSFTGAKFKPLSQRKLHLKQ